MQPLYNQVMSERPVDECFVLDGRYQVIETLSQSGGFGKTYIARDLKRPGQPRCVVKQLKPRGVSDPQVLAIARRLFEEEAETLEKLGVHDQIPRLLAHFEEDREFYLVQELIDGHDLSREMTPGKRYTEAEVWSLLRDVLGILEFVQQHQTIHRDIKPANLIRRRQDNRIVLIDFGSVKRLRTEVLTPSGQPQPSVVVGTPGYMPLEQTGGMPNLSSDLFAVGIIGIQALTGLPPMQLPKDEMGRLTSPAWREYVDSTVSRALLDFLDRLVCWDFRDRYPSAAAALEVLEPPQESSSGTVTRSRSSKVPISIAAGAVVAIAAVGGSIIGLPSRESSPPETPLVAYQSEEFGIEVSHPETWNVQENYVGLTGELLQILSPPETDTDGYRERVEVSIIDLDEFPTLDQFTDNEIENIERQQNLQLIDGPRDTTIANRPGKQVTFTRIQGDRTHFQSRQYWTLNRGCAYFLTYTAEPSKFDRFEDEAVEIVKSFKITPANPELPIECGP